MSGLAHAMALVASGALLGSSLMGIALSLVIERQRKALAAAARTADIAQTRMSCRDTMIRIMDHIAGEQATALAHADQLLRTPHHIGWHDAVARWRAGDAVRRAVHPPGGAR